NDVILREKLIIDFSNPEKLCIKFSDTNDIINAFVCNPQIITLKCSKFITIEPNSICLVQVLPNQTESHLNELKVKICEKYENDLFIPKTVISLKNNAIFVPIVNKTDKIINLRKNKIIAEAKYISETYFAKHAKENSKIDEICESDFKIGNDLDESEKKKAIKLLTKYKNCFVNSLKDVTPTDLIEVNIETNGPPVKRKMYRLPIAHREPLKKILNELLLAKIIRPSVSNYCSPILLVQKKNGDYRLVIDYRDLNATITNENCYPLPRIEDVIDQINGSVMFSLLDCHSGFFILKIAEQDKHKTAFVCPFGFFEFNRLPQGLKISPNNFQMAMERALSPVLFKCAKNFVDDCLVHSKSKETHFTDLDETLACIEKANIKLRPSKWIEIGEDRINAIINIEEPKTVTEIKSFLGVLNYFKDHIKNLQIIAEPLTRLTQLQTELHTDGSNVGIGATLIQIDNEKEKIICYYSRVLSTAEKHYSAIEIELLAIIDGIKRFKHYLIGRKFKIVTDSNPLTYLMRTKNLNSRLSHWSMFLQEYDFEIVYRKGSENKLCDYLSRYPNKEPENEELKLNLFLCEFDFPQINENENFLFDSFLTQLNDISKLQREDKYFSHIIDILNGNTKNKSKSLRRAANNYEIVNGKLYRVIVHNNQFKNLLVIP
ncbi:hypothetical protein B4U79_09290, partial [Dinothrombium tinctorium]